MHLFGNLNLVANSFIILVFYHSLELKFSGRPMYLNSEPILYSHPSMERALLLLVELVHGTINLILFLFLRLTIGL